MEAKHTPLPWTIETPCGFPYSGLYVVPVARKDFPFHIAKIRQLRESEESEANAQHIIRCCNCHDDLLEALYALLSGINNPNPDAGDKVGAAEKQAKAAIAKAE